MPKFRDTFITIEDYLHKTDIYKKVYSVEEIEA